MTKRSRTILFLLFGILFAATAPSVILYSQGYRFDWDTKRIAQIGAISLVVVPNQVDVFVQEKLVGTTGRFVGTSFTKNLAPASYAIRVSKEGYHSWQKTLVVEPKRITEAGDIVLFPSEPAFISLADSVQHVWFAPNNEEALLQKQRGNSWQLVLWSAQRGATYPIFQPQKLQEEVYVVMWAPDSNSFILQTKTSQQTKSFMQRLDRDLFAQQRTNQQSLAQAALLRASLSPPQEEFVTIMAQDAVALYASSSGIFWIDEQNILWRAASFESIPEVLVPEPLLQKEISSFQVSPDNTKIAVSAGREIWLFYLQDQSKQPTRKKGEQVFLTRFSQPVSNVQWIHSAYLVFTLEDTVRILETDERNGLNVIDFAEFPQPALFWNQRDKALYAHTGSEIRVSEKLLP